MCLRSFIPMCAIAIGLSGAAPASADTLTLTDGTVMKDCFVRDEGTRVLVWESMDRVGQPETVIPRSRVKEFKIDRTDAWDVQPALPDLTVTHIEVTPRLAGLHGVVQYDNWGRPRIAGAKALVDEGDKGYDQPANAVANLKLKYRPGEEVTLTAHVRNVGFRQAPAFRYEWLMDGTRFAIKWKWEEGMHEAGFRVVCDAPEISKINNEIADPLWGFAFFYVVSKGRVGAWHKVRSAAGTFCFEDYYRWHLDIMNRLFADSIYPSAPKGIKARVRLDRILYADDVDKSVATLREADGIGYHQGGWIWNDAPEEKQGTWNQVNREWRCATEWSLPHELGHQLGLVDYYAIDYAGHDDHVMPDNGDKITHFQRHPAAMMHWHGPQPFNETDAGYLNATWDLPRGHFGDYYFALPSTVSLRVLDVNGQPVSGARVEVFQRGTLVDEKGAPGEQNGVKWFPVVEDGNFDRPISKDPVIVGATDADGVMALPNRPVKEVTTLNGYRRSPNPFGNINVVGGRGLLLVRVTRGGRACHYFVEAWDLNVEWYRGHKDRCTVVLRTPYGSVGSPPAPANVRTAKLDGDRVKVSWDAPAVVRERIYLDHATAYRVYRRISSDGLNDRPWYPVATVEPGTFAVDIDLKATAVDDVHWFTKTNRFAVTTVGESGIESGLAEVVLK